MFNLKKTIASIAVSAVLMIPVSAEAPAVHDLSDDELKSLYMDVKQELMDRGIWDGATLPAGVYVGGEDLPEGTYSCIANKDGWIFLYPDFETLKEQGDSISSFRVNEGEAFSIKLTNGVCWDIHISATVRPMVGLEW